MHHRSSSSRPFGILSVLFATLVSSMFCSSAAAQWQGTITETDGVIEVSNPSDPSDPPELLELEELWSVGGFSESDDELFGVISSVTTDAQENVYLLDTQLVEIKVFDSEGAYLRTIGREGEGPGEFRRPRDLFTTADGTLTVLQMMPGKMVRLTPDGDPLEDLPMPESDGGGTPRLQGGAAVAGQIVLLTMDMERGEGSMRLTSTLASYDTQGTRTKQLWTSTRSMDFANLEFNEGDSGALIWGAGPQGPIFATLEFGEYTIHVWSPEGELQRIITRDYQHLARTEEEKEEAKSRIGFRGRRRPTIIVSDYHPDVARLYPRSDGSLWVLTSQGRAQAPEATLGVFDVFDAEGRYVKQVTLRGEGDPTTDGYVFLGDRLFVLRHQAGAFAAMFGNSGSDDGDDGDDIGDDGEDLEPMKVICYRLP